MDPVTLAAIIGAVATLGAAIIGKNWGEKQGEKHGREKERDAWIQTLSSAPKLYAERLSELIDKASNAKSQDMLTYSRAIVAVRDDMKGTLVSLSALLNSEIDRLSAEVRDAQAPQASVEPLRSTVNVLKLKWPAKCDQIEIEVRKLLAELGLERGPNKE